jgi:hypothetical protein
MSNPDRRERTWAGVFCLGLGLFLIYVIRAEPSGLRVPPAVGYLAAATFVMAGATLLLQAAGYLRAALVPAFLLVASFAGVGGWVGFGPGPRSCEGSLGMLLFLPRGALCRIVFGTGAVLTGIIALIILRSLMRTGRPPE